MCTHYAPPPSPQIKRKILQGIHIISPQIYLSGRNFSICAVTISCCLGWLHDFPCSPGAGRNLAAIINKLIQGAILSRSYWIQSWIRCELPFSFFFLGKPDEWKVCASGISFRRLLAAFTIFLGKAVAVKYYIKVPSWVGSMSKDYLAQDGF